MVVSLVHVREVTLSALGVVRSAIVSHCVEGVGLVWKVASGGLLSSE